MNLSSSAEYGMIEAEKILAQRTLATLIELRTQPPTDVAYPMMVLGLAMAPQIGITYVDSVAADKRAGAYRTIASLTQSLQNHYTAKLDALWDEAMSRPGCGLTCCNSVGEEKKGQGTGKQRGPGSVPRPMERL